MIVFWTIAFVIFVVVEAATVGLTSIWFALGSLASLLAAFLKAPDLLQIVLFIAVSVIALIFTRPLAVKYLNSRKKATNADRVYEMVGVVIEDIDNVLATGLVSVGGKQWTARSLSGIPIEKDTLVRAVRIEGVKLIVVPVQEKEEAVK